MNVELAEEVRDYIIAHPETHNQHTWSCGTTACIAGHTIRLSDDCSIYGHWVIDRRGNDVGSIPTIAMNLLGLSSSEASDLFHTVNNELALEKLENLIKDHAADRRV